VDAGVFGCVGWDIVYDCGGDCESLWSGVRCPMDVFSLVGVFISGHLVGKYCCVRTLWCGIRFGVSMRDLYLGVVNHVTV
jgi:hypothetical protein